MISFVPTSRAIAWHSAVTLPWVIATFLYFLSILGLTWLNQQTHWDLTPCLFKHATGLPCFLCGGTRASLSLAKGDVAAAFLFNPLVSAGLILVAVLLILKFAVGTRIRIAPKAHRWLWLIVVALVALNWAYVIAHLR